MSKEEMVRKFYTHDEKGREEMLERAAFCSFSDDWDFDNYFRIDELEESELLCLISFLYQQDCYLMMLDIMDRYKERLISHNVSFLDEVDFSERFFARMEKLESLAEDRH